MSSEQEHPHGQANTTPASNTKLMQLVCTLTSNLASQALRTTDAARESHALSHQRPEPAVNGAQDAFFHNTDKVVLSGFLKHDKSRRLEPQVLVVFGIFLEEALKQLLGYEKLGGRLKLSDFAQGDGSGAVPARPLHAGRWVSLQRVRDVMRALPRLLILGRARSFRQHERLRTERRGGSAASTSGSPGRRRLCASSSASKQHII